MMRWIDFFERIYVDLYRTLIVFVALLAVLAMLGAGLFYLSTVLQDKEHHAEDLLTPPRWTDLRAEILPLSNGYENPDATSESGTGQTKQPPEVAIDERVARIHAELSRQFERNTNGVAAFRELLPQRMLQQIIFDGCTAGEGRPERCIEALHDYAQELGVDERINRIGDINARARTLLQALELWFQRYQEAASDAARTANSRDAAEEAAQGVAFATLVAATQTGVGILLAIILLVVLIRIEVHLRSVSSNLQDSRRETPRSDQ
jgi:hypothetical protein